MRRKEFIRQSSWLSIAALLPVLKAAGGASEFPVVRVPPGERRFSSPAIEQVIRRLRGSVNNKELGWLFENCFPNTLDTTVDHSWIDGRPDTFVITGDIDAMWLRDSTAQVWPYLPFMGEDHRLRELIAGVINRQTRCIRTDPYANAFFKDPVRISEWKDDKTDMKPGVHERKWEIDSLCYPIRLAHGYWKSTGDTSVFGTEWMQAMKSVVQTFREQQRMRDSGPYRFERTTSWATDGVAIGGYGYPAKKTGLIHAMFRPSDDATVYPFNIPGNLFAVLALRQLAEILRALPYSADAAALMQEAGSMSARVAAAVERYGVVRHPRFGEIYAYEVNGYGSVNLMDDANVPSLLSLPYLIPLTTPQRLRYRNTRAYVLSPENPFFFSGRAGAGIGGPHAGLDMIWPLSIIMQGLTSSDPSEIRRCLHTLQGAHAGTGFMHESFHKDDPFRFTRKWFAWANTLFGEWVLKLYREKKALLDQTA
ncbi:MAG: hypothetical protein RJA57_1197 [Bacteroidota bacterium]